MAVETPVLDTVTAMTTESVERSHMAQRDLMIARIAALAAVDAPPASYLLNAGAARDAGLTLEDVQGILVAVSPIVGTARIATAGGNIARALGFAIDVAADEIGAEGD